MFPFTRTLSLCLAVFTVAALDSLARAEPVTLTTADKVKVFGSYEGTGDKTKTIMLLFHMAGANAAEYAPIARKLVALGFNTLAIDQRSGGTAFGHANRTVKALGRSTGYRAALPDLEAALRWAGVSGHTGKIVVCGSSYAASLVFLLAAKHPGEIAGLMAFSPGEYVGGKRTVRGAAAKLKDVAVFVTSASDRQEIAAARAIFNAVPGKAKTLFVPKHAPHGASALREDANAAGQRQVWAAVERFLAPLH
jgi:pimeloyl-ACP methyl ester carboxylesterase